ncbi:MAG: L-ribulose-5-phosphate 3-epimerase UlaE [Planctomycetota bacterium]
MSGPYMPIDRRKMLAGAALAGASLFQPHADGAPAPKRNRLPMKKSINQWAFPYPEKMSLEQCLRLAKDAGFDAIELNYDLDNDLSPKATKKDLQAIRALADKIGIQISGLCSFLFWPYPLTANDPAKRNRGMELAALMTQAAYDLGVEIARGSRRSSYSLANRLRARGQSGLRQASQGGHRQASSQCGKAES